MYHQVDRLRRDMRNNGRIYEDVAKILKESVVSCAKISKRYNATYDGCVLQGYSSPGSGICGSGILAYASDPAFHKGLTPADHVFFHPFRVTVLYRSVYPAVWRGISL